MYQRRANESTDERMRGRRGNTSPPGKQIPDNGRYQSRKDHFKGDKIFFHGFGNGICHTMVFEDKEGNEVEERSPEYGLKGGEYFGGYYRGNGVGCIMKTIDVVEYEGQYNNRNQERSHKLVYT